MSVEANILPLPLFIEQRALKVTYQLYQRHTKVQLYDDSDTLPPTTQWPAGKPLSTSVLALPPPHRAALAIQAPTVTYPPPWTLDPVTIITDLPLVKADLTHYNQLYLADWLHECHTPLPIYTDAALSAQGYSCAGFWSPQTPHSHCVQLPDHTSIFYAEAWGLFLALTWLTSRPMHPQKIVIFTDSLSVLIHLKHWYPTSTTDLFTQLRCLVHTLQQTGFELSLVWIPSHSNIPDNDIIDTLVSRTRPQPWCHGPLPLEVFLSTISPRFQRLWQADWSTDSTHLRQIVPTVSTRVHHQCSTKPLTTALTLARVGRLHTNTLRNRWDATQDPSCPYCPGSPHTVQHILLECPESAPNVRSLLPPPHRHLPPHHLYACLLGVLHPDLSLTTRTYDSIASLLLAAIPKD